MEMIKSYFYAIMCQKRRVLMKKLFTVILCLLLFTGCSSKTSKKETKSSQDTSSTDSLDDSFYPIVNLGTNLVRETFYQDFSSSEDFQTIQEEITSFIDRFFLLFRLLYF